MVPNGCYYLKRHLKTPQNEVPPTCGEAEEDKRDFVTNYGVIAQQGVDRVASFRTDTVQFY